MTNAKRRWSVWLCVLFLGVTSSALQRGAEGQPAGEQFLGTWTGTWEGSGTGGGFDLTLEKDKADVLTGRLSVTGEPTYKVTLKTVSFDGPKMTAKYDFPPDDAALVVLAAAFEGNTAKGTWSLREKASDAEVVSGTWTVRRKP